MKKNILLYLGIAFIVICGILTAFTDIGGDIPGIIGLAFGLALTCIGVYKKSEKKNVWTISAIVCAVLGGVFCAAAGLSQDVTISVITAVIAAVSLIASILITVLSNKIKD